MKKRVAIAHLAVTLVSLLAAGCATLESAPDTVQLQPGGNQGENAAPSPQGELASDQASSPAVSTDVNLSAYPVVDTGQVSCYGDAGTITCPEEGDRFFGQDANYSGNQPQYQDHGDGTISDLVTGLTWTQSPDLNGDGTVNIDDKLTQYEAAQMAEGYSFAGYDDWRLPTVKELYSLIDFNGSTGSNPYINTNYFEFGYGDTSAGERDIDAQFATTTIYVSMVMNNQTAMFGVNLADGRIKGYGLGSNPEHPEGKTFYVLLVRGNPDYGINDFVDNQDGTISDRATGLTWMQSDNGEGVIWEEALDYCANLEFAGISDWRLPNAKELQSIVDYSRSPDTTQSAAIDPLFEVTYLPNGINNSGEGNFPAFWTSTTHLDGPNIGANAVYINFGESRGYMNGQLMDVHGAGAQRSDPKSGDPGQYAGGHGPQGDVIGINNYVRCVTGGSEVSVMNEAQAVQDSGSQTQVPNPPQPSSGQSPPQEAVDACANLNQGASCSFSTPQETISGQCKLTPEDQLACVPEDGPPPGGKP